MKILNYCKPENLEKTIGRTSYEYLHAVENDQDPFSLKGQKPIEKRAKIIAFEGLNCCGKSTQKKLIEEQLAEEGHSVFVVPTYETACWDIMSKIGKGTFYINQPLKDTVIWATYFIDQINDVREVLRTQDYVIFDRYKDNYLFIQEAILEESSIYFKREWLKELVSELPEPDHRIFIDIPIAEMTRRYDSRGGRKPLSQEDILLTEKIRKKYVQSYSQNGVEIIDGTKNPWEVFENIYKTIITGGN